MRILNFALSVLFAVVLAAPVVARADDLRPFCADRPGKATPPCILDEGHFQIEVGLADAVFQRAPGAHEDIYTLGASELRLGLTSRLEAEAAWAPVIIDHPKGASQVTGSGDATFGLRYSLTDPSSQGVAVSAQGYVNAPTATHGLGEGGWSGGFRMPIAGPLPNDFSFGFAPEVDVVRDLAGGGTHLAANAALSIGRGFGDNTFGAEIWGQVNNDPSHHAHEASFDLTAAHLFGKNNQLDAGVNFGLNHDTPSTEIYVGLSHRF